MAGLGWTSLFITQNGYYMMCSILKLIILSLVIHGLFFRPVWAQNRPSPPDGPADLYSIVVGVERYTSEGEFDWIPGADQAARMVAEALAARGARRVLLLTGGEGDNDPFVSRQDIRHAIVSLKKTIRADRAKAPKILLYIIGHGMGDPDMELYFSMAGDYSGPLDQNRGLSIIHGTISNIDLFGAMTQFRMHPSMSGWDDLLLPSDAMPDLEHPLESIPRMLEAKRKIDHAEEMGRNGAPKEGNPPVPFVLLFDNCGTEIDQNLVIDGRMILPFMQSSLRELTNEGLAYYAAMPGKMAFMTNAPSPLPAGADAIVPDKKIGPLGRRLLEILRDNPGPLTLSDLQKAFAEPQAYFGRGDGTSQPPFSHGSVLLDDMRNVEVIPPLGREAPGAIEVIRP